MTDSATLISALKAAGHDQAAAIVDAFLGSREHPAAPAPASAPSTPPHTGVTGEQVPPAVAAAAEAGPTPGTGGPLTLEDIKVMSTDQVNARWDEVSAVLEGL